MNLAHSQIDFCPPVRGMNDLEEIIDHNKASAKRETLEIYQPAFHFDCILFK